MNLQRDRKGWVTILQLVMDFIDPPALPDPPKKDIGLRRHY